MNLILLALGALLSSGTMQDEQQRVRLTGPQLRACTSALKEFARRPEKHDLSKYHVVVESISEGFKVVFVPNTAPGETGLVGGETAYGPEVHYIVSGKNFRILRTHYAK